MLTAVPFQPMKTRWASMIERVKSLFTPPERAADEAIRERRLDSLLFGAEQARRRALAELDRTERLARARR